MKTNKIKIEFEVGYEDKRDFDILVKIYNIYVKEHIVDPGGDGIDYYTVYIDGVNLAEFMNELIGSVEGRIVVSIK